MRTVLSLLLFVFCSLVINAQVKLDVNLGLQMGNTTYSNNYPYFTTFKSGFFVGVGLVKEINPNWAIKADFQFSQKGHKITGNKFISFGLIETILTAGGTLNLFLS